MKFLKQLMVAYCSKELVTETLKYEFFIPIDASKESDLYSDFNYTSFIKFSLTNQKLQV